MSKKSCSAYSLRGQPRDLTAWSDRLGEGLVHWVADTTELTMGAGIPQDWKEQGAIFSEGGELRWWRDGDSYRALLLTDSPVPGLEPLAGIWSRDESPVLFFLQSLGASYLRPTFDRYPHGEPEGRFEAVIYRRDGVVVFVSPRRLLAKKEG